VDGELIFTPIKPQFVRSHWPFVRKGAEAIAAKNPVDWIPEDLYCAVRYQTAELVIITRNRAYVGFFVACVHEQLFIGIKQYMIWAFWRDPEAHVAKADRWTTIDALKKRAQDIGCSEIAIGSLRKGWLAYGFQPDHILYRLKV